MNKCDVRKELIKYQENLEYINKLIKTSEVVTPTMYKQKKEIENKIKEVKEKMEQMEKPTKPNTQHNLNQLNEILFEQLEKIKSSDTDLENELRKTYAVSQLAQQIINNANTCIKAVQLTHKYEIKDTKSLSFIGTNEDE